MNITDVRVFPVDEDKLKAYVTITLDDCFVVRDLKVIHGASGLFIAMPAKRRKDGTYKDIAHPLNADTRTQMERVILDAYARQVGGGAGAQAPVGLAAEAVANLRALPPAEAANPASFKDTYKAPYEGELHRAEADAP